MNTQLRFASHCAKLSLFILVWLESKAIEGIEAGFN